MEHNCNPRGLLRRLLCVLAAAALLCSLAAPASAQGLQIGTEVRVYAITGPFEITSKTEDFVLPVGGDQQLRAEASAPVKRWQWEVSTDGGKTWTTVGTDPSYDIRSAQLLQDADGRDIPYKYRVTAESELGETASAEINVLVSDDYAYRTITVDEVSASAYMHNTTNLTVTPLDDGTTDAEYKLRSQLWPDYRAGLLCEVSLDCLAPKKRPYFGEVTLDFHVGTQYNGLTLRIFRYLDGELTEYTATVEDGVVTIAVDELGAFLVEVPTWEPYTITARAGKGGRVSPDGQVQVRPGGEMYFYFIPDAGYTLARVTVDGEPVRVTGSSYHFANVTADHTLRAEFAPLADSASGGTDSSSGSTSGGTSGSASSGAGSSAGSGSAGSGAAGSASGGTGASGSGAGTGSTGSSAGTPAGGSAASGGAGSGAGSTAGSGSSGGEASASRPNGTGNAGTDAAGDTGGTGASGPVSGSASASTTPADSGTADADGFRTVTVNASGHGSVSPSGTLQVADGAPLVLYFYPEDGYEIGTVTVNGEVVELHNGQLTLPRVTDDLDIAVEFVPLTPGAGAATGSLDCHCLWYRLFGVCWLCRWAGRCITPWCWLLPLLAVLALALWLLRRRRKKQDEEKP